MRPAVNRLKKEKIPHTLHSYDHDSTVKSFGREAVEKLTLSAHQVFKTLVVLCDNTELVVAVLPVSRQLDLKSFAKLMKFKKADMAAPGQVERATGYLVGGVSPIGQKKSLRTVIDASARSFDTIFVSGGKRGLQIELSLKDLLSLTRGDVNHIGR